MAKPETPSKLPASDVITLAWKTKNGNKEARNALIECHMYLVDLAINNLKNYIKDYDEAYQEGMVQLIKSIDQFDVGSSNNLSHYARLNIYNGILRTIVIQNIPVKITYNEVDIIAKAIAKYRQFKNTNGTIPTVKDIAEAIEVPVNQLIELLNLLHNYVSLDVLLERDSFDTSLVDNYSIDELTREISLVSDVHQIPDKTHINERQWEIITSLYGIGSDKIYTQIDLGEKLKISNSRVGQLRDRGFERVKFSHFGKELADYVCKKKEVTKIEKDIAVSEETDKKPYTLDDEEYEFLYELNQRYQRNFIEYTPTLSLYLLCVDTPKKDVEDAFYSLFREFGSQILSYFTANLKQRVDTPECTYFCRRIYEEMQKIIMEGVEQSKEQEITIFRFKQSTNKGKTGI